MTKETLAPTAEAIRSVVKHNRDVLRRMNYGQLQVWAKERGITPSMEFTTFEFALLDIGVDYDTLYLEDVQRQRLADSFTCSTLAAVLALRTEMIDNEKYIDLYAAKEALGDCGCGLCGDNFQQIVQRLPIREYDGWRFVALREFVGEVRALMSASGTDPGMLYLWV